MILFLEMGVKEPASFDIFYVKSSYIDSLFLYLVSLPWYYHYLLVVKERRRGWRSFSQFAKVGAQFPSIL